MLVVRGLLYKEKTLDDFDIDGDDSIFKKFFELLLTMDGTRVTDLNVENNITSMFNDACYICTIALIIKRPALQLGYFRELCNQKTFKGTYYSTNEARADVVLCMVYFLLKHCSEGNDKTKNLMSVIDTNLRERSRESYDRYERFFDVCNSFDGMLSPGITAVSLAENILDLRKKAEAYQKKIDFYMGESNGKAEEAYPKFTPDVEQLLKEIADLKTEIDMMHRYPESYLDSGEEDNNEAFNTQTGLPCFTNRQMGIFLRAVAEITEAPNPPGKTTLGEVVEKIAGYKATTVNQNMKGDTSENDKKVVADALDSKLPKLAAKVRKL